MLFSRSDSYRRGVDKTKRKAVLGVIIILFTCFLIWFWMNVAQQSLTYTSVLVFNEDVKAYENVDTAKIVSIRIPKENVVEGLISSEKYLKNKEALVDIPKGMPLVKSFFTDAASEIEDNQFIFAIPEGWVYSAPQTLRRGDEIFLYEIPSEETLLEQGFSLLDFAGTPSGKILKTKVLYVKDAANREVTDVGLNPRYDGSATVSNIEIAVTEKEYQMLYNSFVSGNQFIILYN